MLQLRKKIEKKAMNLTEHYEELYKASIRKIEEGEYHIDSLIDSPDDTRFGITLLIRPPEEIKIKIQLFLEVLKDVDPSQYFYPGTDIHITVMSIISCYKGFKPDQISVPEYVNLIKESINGIGKFRICFRGITASDSGIMVQGFPEKEALSEIRNNLRTKFKNSNLEQSLDKRYKIRTAHSTTVRFRNQLKKKKEFLKVIKKYRDYDFGNFEVTELELVFNDWYQRKENTKLLEKFEL